MNRAKERNGGKDRSIKVRTNKGSKKRKIIAGISLLYLHVPLLYITHKKANVAKKAGEKETQATFTSISLTTGNLGERKKIPHSVLSAAILVNGPPSLYVV